MRASSVPPASATRPVVVTALQPTGRRAGQAFLGGSPPSPRSVGLSCLASPRANRTAAAAAAAAPHACLAAGGGIAAPRASSRRELAVWPPPFGHVQRWPPVVMTLGLFPLVPANRMPLLEHLTMGPQKTAIVHRRQAASRREGQSRRASPSARLCAPEVR
ncbi:uncharacterized protein LOC144178276 isoform X2 [Haemaphysalis longicornis]